MLPWQTGMVCQNALCPSGGMVDARVLEARVFRRVGSSPTIRTMWFHERSLQKLAPRERMDSSTKLPPA